MLEHLIQTNSGPKKVDIVDLTFEGNKGKCLYCPEEFKTELVWANHVFDNHRKEAVRDYKANKYRINLAGSFVHP